MQCVLRKTDIFDNQIGQKLSRLIKKSKEGFVCGTAYAMEVSFHVDLLTDPGFEEFIVPVPSKTNKGTKEDKIYDVLSHQLNTLEDVLLKNGLEVSSATIKGVCLRSEDITIIEIFEDTSEPHYTGRGKDKKRIRCHSIVPSQPYIQDITAKLALEKLSKMFYDLMNVIKNKKIMSEIFEIEETQDDKILFTAFVKEYGDLWLATDKRREELLGKLKERMLSVFNRHIGKDKEESDIDA